MNPSSSSGSMTMNFPSLLDSSSAKNTTRIASILGTWTGQTHLKTDIGSYELMAYFVIHFMPDPMRGYGCELSDCHEMRNQLCSLDENYNPTCQNMVIDKESLGGDGKSTIDTTTAVVDWSDVVAFMYFGAKVDVGFPFNKHRSEDTGGWVGPINIVMAQNQTLILSMADNDNDHAHIVNKGKNMQNMQNGNILVDQYVSRYVETPNTSFLKMPKGCSLINKEDFEQSLGLSAVRSTVESQERVNEDQKDGNDNEKDNDDDNDPYAQYKNTCQNGNVRPILPKFQFDFTQNPITKEESLDVKLHYKLMTMPKKKDYMYKLYPMVQKRFNNADVGFHISGPYCYGDDPKRGYTFDMDFDSKDPKAMLQLDHGCIDGLPCLPPAAELGTAGSKIDVHPNSDGTTIKVGNTIYFVVVFGTLFICMVVSVLSNLKLRRKLAKIEEDRSSVASSSYSPPIQLEMESPVEVRQDDSENDTTLVGHNSSSSYASANDEMPNETRNNDGEDEDDLSTPLIQANDCEEADEDV